ncbi:ParB/RepB/Spo0J family partition protein [Streptomyces tubercidicus]|uniref:ParB/RepB/Spo0J family partition protein n=1 Tax=Streptomyces tubercidicus TaxID=47759 RepID=UPI00346548FF
MPKHDEFDDFFDDDNSTPIVDTRADGRLYRVPLGRLAANLVNPREDFGSEDQLMDLGKSLARRQLQACPVVTRGAYLKLWPDHAKQIGDVDYVLVSGERRFRGATAVGLHSLNCVADDNVAADRKTFMEAVVSENVDRQNFDAVEEAYAVQALVTEFGTNRAVAQHFERADGWVTQRILLTHLAPEMQKLVRKKSIPLEFARNLGKLARDNDWSPEEQSSWWSNKRSDLLEKSKGRKAEKKAAKKPASPATPPPERKRADPPSHSAELSEPDGEAGDAFAQSTSPAAPGAPEAVSFTAVKQGGKESGQEEEASQADPGAVELPSLASLPWHNTAAILRILREHMQPPDFERLMKEGNESI